MIHSYYIDSIYWDGNKEELFAGFGVTEHNAEDEQEKGNKQALWEDEEENISEAPSR